MPREAIVTLAILVLLAGCVAPEANPDEDLSSTSASESELAKSLNAMPAPENVTLVRTSAPNVTTAPPAEPWWLATVQATPEAGLSAFWWTLPSGAAVEWGYNELFEANDEVVAIEVALIAPTDAKPTAWGLVAFAPTDDGSALDGAGGILEITSKSRMSAGGVTMTAGVETTKEPNLEPRFVHLVMNPKPGDRVAMLAFVQADPAEYGIAFRVLDHDPEYPDSDEEPVATSADFVGQRGDARPLAVATKKASGFSMQGYFELGMSGTGTLIERVGDLKVEDSLAELREIGGPRVLAATTQPAFDVGWAISGAGYSGWGTGASRWAASVQGHGLTTSGEGVTVEAFPTIFLPLAILGNAGAYAIGDGDDPLTLTFETTRLAAPGIFHVWTVFQLELGAKLADLFGVPSVNEADVGADGPLPIGMDESGTLRWYSPQDAAVARLRTTLR